MRHPIFSVIIPAYNCASFVSIAMESVLEQTLQDLELIVINDCSTDDTEAIVLSVNDNRIIYIKNLSNQGVSRTRNIGVECASGEYIAFLDADDFWDETKLEKQLFILTKKKAKLVYTAREFCLENGDLTGKVTVTHKMLTYKKLLWHNCIPCSSVVIPREVALEFPMSNGVLHEDYLTWLKILKKYGLAYGIAEPLLKYRLTAAGKSRNWWASARMTYTVYQQIGLSPTNSFIRLCWHNICSIIDYQKLITKKL